MGSEQKGRSVLNPINTFAGSAGLVLFGRGVWLVFQGGSETELFGSMFKSLYVGVGYLILGAALLGVVIWNIEKTVREFLDSLRQKQEVKVV